MYFVQLRIAPQNPKTPIILIPNKLRFKVIITCESLLPFTSQFVLSKADTVNFYNHLTPLLNNCPFRPNS